VAMARAAGATARAVLEKMGAITVVVAVTEVAAARAIGRAVGAMQVEEMVEEAMAEGVTQAAGRVMSARALVW